jgi:hypothetical protein
MLAEKTAGDNAGKQSLLILPAFNIILVTDQQITYQGVKQSV